MKTAQRNAIIQHGKQLLEIFPQAIERDPLKLCKKLRKLEIKAHALAETHCNFLTKTEVHKRKTDELLQQLDDLLWFRVASVPVFLNGDPRGYALKIDDSYVREHNLNIHRDWGGSGIIAPVS